MSKAVKALVVALSLMLCVSLLPGCGIFNRAVGSAEPGNTTSHQEPASNQRGTTPGTGEPGEPTEPSGGSGGSGSGAANGSPLTLSDDPYSFTLELDGKVYALPAPFEEFAADGWEIQYEYVTGGADKKIKSDEMTTAIAQKSGYQVYLSLVNDDVDARLLPECQVFAVKLYDTYNHNVVSLVFPGGVTMGTSKKELVRLYGEPSGTLDLNTATILEYSLAIFASLELTVENKTGLITALEMSNKTRWEASEPYQGKAPKEVLNYKAPTALGKSWDSGIVRFDGDLYQMPIPISALVDNGWIIVTDPNQMVSAGDTYYPFIIRRGNQSLSTNITNYADTQQPAKYCFITSLDVGGYKGDFPFELSGGLSLKSSVDDFLKACGKPRYQGEGKHPDYYSWGDYPNDLSIYIDKDTGAVSSIRVIFNPRSL